MEQIQAVEPESTRLEDVFWKSGFQIHWSATCTHKHHWLSPSISISMVLHTEEIIISVRHHDWPWTSILLNLCILIFHKANHTPYTYPDFSANSPNPYPHFLYVPSWDFIAPSSSAPPVPRSKRRHRRVDLGLFMLRELNIRAGYRDWFVVLVLEVDHL